MHEVYAIFIISQHKISPEEYEKRDSTTEAYISMERKSLFKNIDYLA